MYTSAMLLELLVMRFLEHNMLVSAQLNFSLKIYFRLTNKETDLFYDSYNCLVIMNNIKIIFFR